MKDLIYDWNAVDDENLAPARVKVQDATLSEASRDPRVGPLNFDDARALVEQSVQLEVDSVDLGWVVDSNGLDRMSYLLQGFRGRRAACSVRAEPNILKALAQLSAGSGIELEVYIADPLKGYNPSAALNCCRRARELGLDPILTLIGAEILEPWRLDNLLTAAVHAECRGVHFFDSAGRMSVAGVGHVVRFGREHFAQMNSSLTVAWSGADGHGLALAKALEAVQAGAHLVRASLLGLGRNGYTPLELLLVNLRLQGLWNEPLQELARYVELAADKLGFCIPGDYPVFGSDAFRTASESQATAMRQAPNKGIAELVHCSVPASWVGQRPSIEIGSLSGRGNVIQWMEQRNLRTPAPEIVDKILAAAQTRSRTLIELEVFELLAS